WLDDTKSLLEGVKSPKELSTLNSYIINIDQKLLELKEQVKDPSSIQKTHKLFLDCIGEKRQRISYDFSDNNEQLECKDFMVSLSPESLESLIEVNEDQSITVHLIGDEKTYTVRIPFDTELLDLIPKAIQYHIAKTGDKETIKRFLGKSVLSRMINLKKNKMAEVLIHRNIGLDEKWLGHTPLRFALSHNNVHIIKMLIEKGADPNCGQTDSRILNFTWEQHGFGEIVKLLIDHGANTKGLLPAACKSGDMDLISYLIERGEKLNYDTLNDACCTGQIEVVKKHIEAKIPLNPKDVSKLMLCPLFYAIESSVDLVELLISSGVDVENTRDNRGDSALHIAASQGKSGMIDLFDILDLELRNQDGRTPLYFAARNNHVKSFEKLMKKGADVTTKDHLGNSLLHATVAIDILKMLFDKIDVNSKNDLGDTPFMSSLRNWSENKVKFFLENGADPNELIGYSPPFSLALINTKNKEIFDLFIEKGAEINPDVPGVVTPLSAAIRNNNHEAFDQLIKLGAEINPKNPGITPPLIEALEYNRENLMARLLEYGANVNAIDPKSKLTPLMMSLKHAPHAVKILLKQGADTTAVDTEGRSCFQMANIWGEGKRRDYRLFYHKLLHDYGAPLKEEDLDPNKGFTCLYLDLLQSGRVEKAQWMDDVLDGKLSENADRLMLAHRFALEKTDDHGFYYEGFWPDFTYPELAQSFSDFIHESNYNIDLGQEVLDEIIDTFSAINGQMTDESLYTRYKEGKPVIIPTGWEAHSTATLIKGDTLLQCNKGGGKTNHTISFFQGDQFKNIKQEFFGKSIYSQNHICHYPDRTLRNSKEQKMLFGLSLNVTLEEPILEESFATHSQKTGNCTWASAKLALRGMLYLAYKEKYPELLSKNIKEVVDSMFKEWRMFDLEKGLERYLQKHTVDGHIDEKADLKMLNLIKVKCVRKSIGGKTEYGKFAKQIEELLAA
ncbi:MAG: hypothetical protein K940chlam3_01054, partial [Chlamydiae bacterium]|nr:hypothetical protein [Chlamydiota bacterium]